MNLMFVFPQMKYVASKQGLSLILYSIETKYYGKNENMRHSRPMNIYTKGKTEKIKQYRYFLMWYKQQIPKVKTKQKLESSVQQCLQKLIM